LTRPTEKQLDAALDEAFKSQTAFAQWFLTHTKFADREATYFWSRSNHPWGRIHFTTVCPLTGTSETSLKESETDVLVVFRAKDGQHIALHIENKIGSGKFTALQPEMYAQRAEQWRGNPKYGTYEDFDTVLLAPRVFQTRNAALSSSFGCFIAHEDVARFIPMFGQALTDEATRDLRRD
jgi:hypothetical protein